MTKKLSKLNTIYFYKKKRARARVQLHLTCVKHLRRCVNFKISFAVVTRQARINQTQNVDYFLFCTVINRFH